MKYQDKDISGDRLIW